MYAQITTRCNMSCAHCALACTSEGDDMEIDVFHKIAQHAQHAQHADHHLTLGGGEPTIHPKFWEFLDLAIEEARTSGAITNVIPSVITNGSMTRITLELAALAKEGKIACALSLDSYHDPIDPRVIKAFEGVSTKNQYIYTTPPGDYRLIRVGDKGLINSGRCDWGSNKCVCEGTFIKPSGAIHHCGCADSPVVGHIQDGFPSALSGECYKEVQYEEV